MGFLSTLANPDDSWFILNDLAHRFSSDSPYSCQHCNSVVLLGEGLIVEEAIRSHNGPEFVAQNLRKWLAATGAKTLYIEPGSP